MSTGAKIGMAFAVAIGIIVALGISAYVSTQQLLEANRLVTHTHQVIEESERLLSSLKDAETGQQGFVLTGEDRYLEPYNTAVVQIRHEVEVLVTLTCDSQDQQQSLQRIQGLSNDKLAELGETIQLRRKAGLKAALPVILSDRGKKIMDDLRGVVGEMETREQRLLDQRSAAARASADRTIRTIAVWMPLSLLVLAIAVVLLMRTARFGGAGASSGPPKSKLVAITIQYSCAVILVAMATLLRWQLLKSFDPLPLFLTFYPAVLLAATIGGGGPGILATALAALAAYYWFIAPFESFHVAAPNDVLSLGIFTGTCLFLSILAERLRRSRWAEALSLAQEHQLDEMARLNEELSHQSEELSQQNEELSQQSEELTQQNEELQTQSEEIQTLNAELGHREDILQKLLDSARLGTAEQAVMQDICAAAKEMFGPAASAVIVLEPQENQLALRAKAGLGPEAAKLESVPAENCFAELVIAQNKTAALTDASLRTDFTMLHLPGEQPFLAVLAAPMRANGNPFGVVGIYSHQKQQWTAEQFRLAEWLAAQCAHILETLRLQEQTRRQAALIELSPDAIIVRRLDGTITFWSRGAETLYGWTKDEALGRQTDALFQSRFPKPMPQIVAQLKRTGRWAGDIVHHVKDGREIVVQSWWLAQLDAQGGVTELLESNVDITERKRAEELLERERANLRAVFDVVNVGMLVIGEDGAVRQVNDTLSRWVRKDLLAWEGGQPGDFVGCVHALADPAGCGHSPKCAACPIRNTFASVLQTGQPIHDVETEAILLVDGSEVRLWLEVSADPLLLDGKPHVILSMNNITARKQAEQTLAQTAEELARSNKDLEQFASVASHDLQEPLRTVTGFVQLLQKKYASQLDAEANTYIGYAVDGAKRMETLIRDLLAYSRVSVRGKELTPTDAREALRRALDNLQTSIHETAAEITHGELPTVQADGTQLAQLFQNLIGNALKFRGAAPPKIHVDASRTDGQWQFTVRDNGIGIEAKYKERIFEIFQRLHRHTEYPGTGVGLAICNRIVDRHGGRIWVESQPGEGAAFHFTFPA